MKIILDQDLYKWLLGLDVLKMSAISRHLSDGTILLDPSLESFFSTGLLFSRLIARLVKSLSKSGNMGHINLAALETIKVNAGSASITHNWNLITDVLKQLGIKVDKEIKNLIINGDFDMIQDLLKQIYDFYHPKNGPKGKNDSMISKGGSPSGGSSLETSPLKMTQKSSLSPSKTQKFETDAIDIDRVRADKDLDSTSSVLEFFLVSLAKNLALEPKQTISLLANNFKYLAHILAKGAKGLFEPVAYWYLEISTHVEHLVTLILKDKENNLTLVQQACRPGLLSKSPEIVECACEFFSKLAYELTNRELMPLAWDWFVSDHGGMQACLWGLKRHPHLVESVIAVLIQYSRLELLDLLTIHLKNVCFDIKEQIATMSILFKPLSESSATKDEILNSGVVEAWAETAGRFLENDVLIDVETRQAALKLMSDIWITHPTKVEQQDYLTASVLNGLKKAARDRSKPVVMETICIMFRLLEHFAAEKSNYAAVIYKTLTFSLIENYHSTTIKEFLIRNFKALFEQNQTVPIAILLDPLLKHMQASEATASTMNMFELEFFYSLMRHPKFNETNALQLFYVMADTYLNNLAFSKDSLMILLELLNNYLNSEPLQEAIIKFIKASLAMFYSSEKNKRPKPKASYYHQSLSPVRSPSNAENDADTLKAQKRAMIIQILRAIIGLRNPNINDRAKAFILYTHIQLKTQLNSEHRGILSLLSLYGDPNELVSQFEREMKSPTKNPDLSMSMSPEQLSPTKESRLEDSMISQGDNPYSLNLLKNTAMSPKMKTLQSPKMTNSDSHKKLPKPDPKIEGMLGTVQKEFTQKQVQQIVEVDANKEKLDRQKKAMKIQLEKRKIELGVASRNQKDAEVNIVFEEGSRELEKMLEKKHGLSEIELVNLEDEEERDREAVQIFLKKYYKVLHYLFVSYANVGFQIQDHDSFTKLADRLSVMNLTDIWKLLSEHDCTKYTQQEEVYSLVRLINTRIFNRSEIKNLTFQGFKEFFVQLAVLIFSRPPKDLSYMPIFVSVETLLQTFKEATKKKGKTTLLYDDPYSTEVGEKDLHAFLNDALKKDPEYPLPEAYKKVVEQNIEFKYELPESLKIPDKYLMCYQIVEDLLIKAVGVRLVEPMVSFTSIAKAKLKVFDPTKIEYSPDHHLKATHSQKKVVKAETTNTPTKRKVLQIENKIKMSIEMKKEVAGFPYKDRATAQEVAEVLEGMLQMVTEGKASPEGKKESALKIKQKEMKEKEKEELLKLEAVAEKKRQKRAEEVKVKHQELKTKKEETDKIKAAMESPLKKKEEQRAKYVNELKEKAKDIKEKKEEEKKKKQEEEEQKKKAEEEEKKNKFKTFHTQKMEDLTKKLQENKGKKEEEEKKKAEKEEEEKKKKVNRDKQIKEIAEMNKEIKEKNKETTTRIKGMIKESEMKKVFDKYNKQLKTLFKFYVDSQHLSLAVGHTLDALGFQSFATFAADFNIFPGIIPLRELRLLYNTLTVGKKPEPDVPLGITYDEFLESLLRISIKAREKLDRIYGINKQLEESHEKEAVKEAEEELKRQREDKGEGHNEEEAGSPVDKNVEQADTYEEIEGTTKNTLEGLLYYLDLPKDRASVLKMLVGKKESRPKNWREKVNYWKKDLVVDNLQDMLVGKMPGLGGLGLGGLGGSPTANEGPTE